MNATAQAEYVPVVDEAEYTTLPKVDEDPKLILLGKVDAKAYMAELRASVAMQGGDTSTAAGRDKIKSAAQSIRTRKAAIDRARKGLTEHWRNQTAAVNAVGKVIEADLDALIHQIRAPVTEWEQAEDARKAEADRIIADLTAAPTVTFGMTSEQVQERLDRIRGMNLNPDVLGVRIEMATDLRDDAVAALTKAVADLKANEAQAAELAELRAQQLLDQERREREEQERIAKEAAEAAAKAEAERLERAKVEAAEQAMREAEQRAEQERLERERAAQAEIDAANRRAAEAEAAAKVEQDRIAQAEADRKRGEEIAAEAQRKREADIAHRAEVFQKAADALIGIPGMTQKMAKAVLHEIAAGTVPAVSIQF